MNRRGFLFDLAAAVAGATFDRERMLWTPGAKLISIPNPTALDFYALAYTQAFCRFQETLLRVRILGMLTMGS